MYVPEDQHVPAGLPVLISFPRTGSHWLRMAVELYFDRPMLTRHFFEHASDRMLLFHDHDKRLDFEPRGPVVYLYRGPVDVVFSELTYTHGEAAVERGAEEVIAVANHYRRHLRRWLLGEGRGGHTPEAVVAYEWILDRPIDALRPVVEVLADDGDVFDQDRLAAAWAQITPSVVRERTEYIASVMDRAANKELRRALFRYRFGGRVLDVFRGDDTLRSAMDPGVLHGG